MEVEAYSEITHEVNGPTHRKSNSTVAAAQFRATESGVSGDAEVARLTKAALGNRWGAKRRGYDPSCLAGDLLGQANTASPFCNGFRANTR
jgi:hypothetical protein